jgi:hypothetical protein
MCEHLKKSKTPGTGDDVIIDLTLPPAVEAGIRSMKGPCFIGSLPPLHGAAVLAHAIRQMSGGCPPPEEPVDAQGKR